MIIEEAEAVLLLKKTLNEILFRIGIDVTAEYRYAAYLDYRSCITLYFRNNYGLSYQTIGSLMKKNHATIINSYKRGKTLLEGPRCDIHSAYDNFISIVQYCEVTLGINSDNRDSLQSYVLDAIQDFIEINELDQIQTEVLANGIIEKIQNRYCGI